MFLLLKNEKQVEEGLRDIFGDGRNTIKDKLSKLIIIIIIKKNREKHKE